MYTVALGNAATEMPQFVTKSTKQGGRYLQTEPAILLGKPPTFDALLKMLGRDGEQYAPVKKVYLNAHLVVKMNVQLDGHPLMEVPLTLNLKIELCKSLSLKKITSAKIHAGARRWDNAPTWAKEVTGVIVRLALKGAATAVGGAALVLV